MIKNKIYGDTLKEQYRAAAEDKLYRFILDGGKIRGAVLKATKMVSEMRFSHDLGILETLLLGHAYMAVALVGADLKGNERIKLQIDCSGSIKGLSVEANVFGEVRGYLHQNPIPVETPPENYDLSPFFGAGFLSLTKHLEDAKHPFTGKVMLQHGNIAQDMAHYFLTSEQLPTAFNLSVQFDPDGTVVGGGGLLLQVLPGADEAVVKSLEERVRALPSLGAAFAEGEHPSELVQTAFARFAPKLLDDKRIEFMCHCSRKRMQDYLKVLPEKELADILETGPFPLDLRCHHCNSTYSFAPEDIKAVWGKKISGE